MPLSRRDLLIGGVGLLGALSLAGCGSGSKPGATGTTTSQPKPDNQDSIYTQAKGPAPLTLAKQGSGYGTTFMMGIAS